MSNNRYLKNICDVQKESSTFDIPRKTFKNMRWLLTECKNLLWEMTSMIQDLDILCPHKRAQQIQGHLCCKVNNGRY